MEDQVIVTTPAQLQSIIGEAVGAIIPKLADFRRKNEAVETDGMTVEEAARFLHRQVNCSKQPYPIISNYYKRVEYQCVLFFPTFQLLFGIPRFCAYF